jgi:beta-lactamase regulating signal transducer with metallopeptidase domain
LSIRVPPEVLAVPGRLPPLVVPGWRRARLLLPADLLDQLDEPQRTVLLLHELAHIKRRDHLVRLLEVAVTVLYWWLPGVGAIGRRLRACEEACCDAAVVARLPDARRDYARLLLDVIDFLDSPHCVAPHATAMSAADDLEARLRGILDPARTARGTPLAGVLAVGLACAVLPCELRYEFTPRPAPVTPAVDGDPETCAPPPVKDADVHKWVGCCPS